MADKVEIVPGLMQGPWKFAKFLLDSLCMHDDCIFPSVENNMTIILFSCTDKFYFPNGDLNLVLFAPSEETRNSLWILPTLQTAS